MSIECPAWWASSVWRAEINARQSRILCMVFSDRGCLVPAGTAVSLTIAVSVILIIRRIFSSIGCLPRSVTAPPGAPWCVGQNVRVIVYQNQLPGHVE